MIRKRNAKIVATVGPASQTREIITQLHKSGVDVFRLNFSHGSHTDHEKSFSIIRSIEQEVGHPIAVLMDLQGPKLRIGTFQEGCAILEEGHHFTLSLDDTPGNKEGVCLPHPEIFEVAEPGISLLLDDGRILLEVLEKSKNQIFTIVRIGGKLSDNKGVNVPDTQLPITALTSKDRQDLMFGLDLGVDWVALSFVQSSSDIDEARKLIAGRAKLLAKLEKPAALSNLSAIVEKSDAIMVARGDLGVEVPPEKVPAIQKEIIAMCREYGRPVVVATQMLESMIDAPVPTRAEASDVAGAIYDGADAVMLSAETAVGTYPIESVEVMERVICSTEQDPVYRKMLNASRPMSEPTDSDGIAAAACHIAETRGCRAVVTFSTTGSTTMRAARYRGHVPVLGLTMSDMVSRALVLVWGVQSFRTNDAFSFAEMVDKSTDIARDEKLAKIGERIVVTAGVPFGTPGATNVLRIVEIER